MTISSVATSRRSSVFSHRLPIRQKEKEIFAQDRELAMAVLSYWFDELGPEKWFQIDLLVEDRIRREFGSLHSRASAGELYGWKAGPETCLALVVVLDQFSRHLYRGRQRAYDCDALARDAAAAALSRGDDNNHWPPGPKRSALYLPFMHTVDMAETWSMMTVGLEDGDDDDPTVPPSLDNDIIAAILQAKDLDTVRNQSRTQVAAGDAQPIVLPRLTSADAESADAEVDDAILAACTCGASGDRTVSATTHTGTSSPHGAGGSREVCSPEFVELAGSYPVETALSLPRFPSGKLSHKHSRRFRSIAFDEKLYKAYVRHKSNPKLRQNYQCLVCLGGHRFKLDDMREGAEDQHLYPYP